MSAVCSDARCWRGGSPPVTQMVPPRRASGTLDPQAGWAGTDCTYSNGQIEHGSSMKTLYIGPLFPHTCLMADTMQLQYGKKVVRKEGRKNRESAITLTRAGTASNRK